MDRRQFLKTVALGAGAALVPSTVFAFNPSFDPGFKGKRFSLVWRGDNYHCYYTDKTFVVAHKARGFIPAPADCPDPTYQTLKKNSFEHLLDKDKDRIVIQKKKLLEMIDKSGNKDTPHQSFMDPSMPEIDRVLLVVNRYGIRQPKFRYFIGKCAPMAEVSSPNRRVWVGMNIDSIRMMLKSAPDTILMAFNDKTLCLTNHDRSWAAFLAVLA